ncbi:hypothetical protein GBA63_19780 [Rubrobacter tropicus]|uniref:Uncharacterized protein n=1 Tax=Rubrobacter tropicus TaxID=2653851 RepID=A0A6G8QE12_9ACTN|nr:hypothetical protein [Rubrobacter tropicus]QIN84641.1 hypothetical protein GBA63_19780 [Rubrobacter tropicus]
MWSVFNEADARYLQQLSEGLAEGAAVPENLWDAVATFVLSRVPAPPHGHALGHRQHSAEQLARREAQEKVLRSLAPRTGR